jgi:hypothetical protein
LFLHGYSRCRIVSTMTGGDRQRSHAGKGN